MQHFVLLSFTSPYLSLSAGKQSFICDGGLIYRVSGFLCQNLNTWRKSFIGSRRNFVPRDDVADKFDAQFSRRDISTVLFFFLPCWQVVWQITVLNFSVIIWITM